MLARCREPQPIVLPPSKSTYTTVSSASVIDRPVCRPRLCCGACSHEIESQDYFCGYCGVQIVWQTDMQGESNERCIERTLVARSGKLFA